MYVHFQVTGTPIEIVMVMDIKTNENNDALSISFGN